MTSTTATSPTGDPTIIESIRNTIRVGINTIPERLRCIRLVDSALGNDLPKEQLPEAAQAALSLHRPSLAIQFYRSAGMPKEAGDVALAIDDKVQALEIYQKAGMYFEAANVALSMHYTSEAITLINAGFNAPYLRE